MSRFLPLLLFLGLLSCAEPGPGAPPAEVKSLAPVVAELQMAEALTGEIPVLVRDSLRNLMYDSVLADHNLDRPTFDSLLWIVRAEPIWVDSLYTKVGELLTKVELENKENRE